MQPHDKSESLDAAKLSPVVKLLRSDKEAIVLECVVIDFQSQEQLIDNRRFHFLSLPEAGYTSQAGYPQLPVKGVLVAVPPEAKLHFTVLESSDVLLSGYHVPPVPQPIVDPMEDEPQFDKYEYKEDSVIYLSNRFYPDRPAEIRFSGILRDQHVACIQFYPLRYNPVTEQVYFHQSIKVQISLATAKYPGVEQEPNVGSPTARKKKETELTVPSEIFHQFEPLYKNAILNYELAKGWRIEPKGEGSQFFRRVATTSASNNSYKIYIREPGIYVLDDSDLRNAGLDLSSMDPRRIVLTNHGVEIPIYVYGEEDGRFDAGDYIEFYGTVYEEDYGPYNVYWLSTGMSDGLRIERKDGSPSKTLPMPESFLYTAHEEKNELHWATFSSAGTADTFFWKRIFALTRVDLDVNVNHLASTEADCTVRIMIQGNTKQVHHTLIYFNDQLLEDATWHGQTQHLTEVQMPQTLLKEGTNTVSVELPGDITDVDAVYLNWFAIDYYRRFIADNDSLEFNWQGSGGYHFQVEGFTQRDISVFDITDVTNPVWIIHPKIESAGTKYRVSFQNKWNTANTYLALTAAQKRKPAKIVEDIPSNLRSTENGSDYIIITRKDFYESILPLVQLREQEGARVKVVEVEDIYDEFGYGLHSDKSIRDFLRYAYHNWTPPAPFCVLLVGDASYDHKDYLGLGDLNLVPTHLFATAYLGDSANDTWFVAVNGDDVLPDMIIGRLPVRTAAQAEAVVEKIINYERYAAPGDWQRHILLVADDDQIFEKDSEELAEKIPADHRVTKVYLSSMTPESASGMVIDTINEGCVLANYAGHGGWDDWASEDILTTEHIPLLHQTSRLPFVVNMTCLVGYFHHPSKDNILGENLVNAAGKGAIATLTPGGASTPAWQSTFNKLLFESFFMHGHQRLGTAIMEARISLVVNGIRGDDSEIYNLLGDAALKLALAEENVAWDVNGDGVTNFVDFVMAASYFGERITPFAHPNPDVNRDGVINVLDLVIIGTHFGMEYDEAKR